MKNIALLLFVLTVFSCNSVIDKPDNLLDKDIMTNILYDINVLQAANIYSPNALNENDVRITSYIYKKYAIDSITYHQNHKYYASNPKVYKKMFNEVIKRLESEKEQLEKNNTVVN